MKSSLFQRPHTFCCAVKGGHCPLLTFGLGHSCTVIPVFYKGLLSTLHCLGRIPPIRRELLAGFTHSCGVWDEGLPMCPLSDLCLVSWWDNWLQMEHWPERAHRPWGNHGQPLCAGSPRKTKWNFVAKITGLLPIFFQV